MKSSKDFTSTTNRLGGEIPNRLLHAGVENKSSMDAKFNGERKHEVFVVDLPSKTLSMTIGGLEPGQITNRHRHSYETMIYILEGSGETAINDQIVNWTAGDAIYVPVWAWHSHRNTSQTSRSRYLAYENAPLLQNLGGLAIREEEGEI